MAGYTYRLPRKYRYPKGGGDIPRPVLVICAAVLAMGAAGGAARGAHSAQRHGAHAVYAPAGSTVALGRQMAADRGWTGSQWTCLYDLWEHESGWRMVWNTAGSGAYGIPQALPASKMASAGPDYMTNPATQIRWGLGYISGQYGTPCGAWNFELSHTPNWY